MLKRVMGVVVVALLLAGCGGSGGSGLAEPRATKEGLEWKHEDMFAYLKGKGLVDRWEPKEAAKEFGVNGNYYRGNDRVSMALCKDTRTAQEYASGMAGPDQRRVAWGRYCIAGNAELVTAIQAVLK